MEKEKLIKVLIDCITKKDYSTLISRTTYEERYDFFYRGKLIDNKGNNVFAYFGNKGMFENLFTETEARNLINSFIDAKSRYIIILNLSDEEKTKYISEIIESYNQNHVIGDYPYTQRISMGKYFASFKDKELMSKTICENYELFQNIDEHEIIKFIENINDNYKKKLFNEIVIHQLNGKKKVIKNYNITTIIKCFPEHQKEEVLDILLALPKNIGNENEQETEVSDTLNSILQSIDNMLLEQNEEKNKPLSNTIKEGLVDSYSISQILDCFLYENKKHILEKLYKHFKEKNPYTHIDRTILKKFKIEDLQDVIKIFIDIYSNKQGVYKYQSDIKEFCTDYNSTLLIINMTIELEEETNIKLLSGYTLSHLIDKLSFEQKLLIFNTYVLENKNIDTSEFVISIEDTDFKYSVLEELIKIDYFKDKTFEKINSIIQERDNDRFADGKINHPIINKLYCEKYILNEENFSMMISNYGYIIIKFLDNQNFINTINLPREDFIKYLKIFDNHEITNDDINSVCNSLLQREFRLKNKEDYNIFNTIERIISSRSDNSKQELINIISKINEIVDINSYLKKYDIKQNEFIELLLINNTNSINILHEITNKYISLKREIYVNGRLQNINEELYLEKRIEKQFYKRTYISQVSENDIMYDIRFMINRNTLDEEQLKLINNKDLLSKIIKFKKDPSSYVLAAEEKSSLKIFETLLNILYEQQIRKKDLETENSKYSYHIFESTREDILNIMTNINVDNLQKNVLKNDALYRNLLEIIEKYHFIGWHKTFTELAAKADIDLSDGTIAGIISYFNEIDPKLNGNQNFLTSLLDYGNLYDYASVRYKHLLGSEDFALIAANEGKNKASMTKYKRLEQSVSFVKKMYERNYTTIPPMDKDIAISNGKKINAVVGNSTNMINLTYGERTESCLRIGGAFADLFNFCISNENGFHIRFTNPTTGNFISRVSGIRNGNTLFLNELRESVDDSYSNDDIIESLKEVSNELIKESKNTDFPIDNIIITSDYALKPYESEEKPLHLNKDRSILYNLQFNIKVEEDKGIILKTSAEDNSLVPYKFSRDNTPKYKCQRDKVKVLYGKEGTNRIIQLHIIDKLLSGTELEDIEINLNINSDLCISGEDWYIAKTIDNQIVKYIMTNSKNKEAALEELTTYLEKIENYNKEVSVRRNR